MNDEIVLHLPWPPTVNNYYSHTRYGVRRSKKGRLYGEAVAESVREQMHRLDIEYKMHVEIFLYPPDKRRRDLDNYMKALLDSCTDCGLWMDDSLIDQLWVYRGSITKFGSVIMKINEAGPVMPYPAPC